MIKLEIFSISCYVVSRAPGARAYIRVLGGILPLAHEIKPIQKYCFLIGSIFGAIKYLYYNY